MRQDSFWNSTFLVGGVLTLAVGGFVLHESAGYARGTILRMGPGFFPTMLGVLLLVFGVLLLLGALRRNGEKIRRPEFRALICVLAGLGLFAVILPRFGMAPAIVALVLTAAAASPSTRPRTAIILAAALTVFAWVIFVVMLSLPLPMLAW